MKIQGGSRGNPKDQKRATKTFRQGNTRLSPTLDLERIA